MVHCNILIPQIMGLIILDNCSFFFQFNCWIYRWTDFDMMFGNLERKTQKIEQLPELYIFLTNQIIGFFDQLQELDKWMKTLYFLHDVIEYRKNHFDDRITVWPGNSAASKILGLLITSNPRICLWIRSCL